MKGLTMPDIGSSPLARGLPLGAAKTELGDRIIPARAGFTALEGRGSALLRDHPRSRGVYDEIIESDAEDIGSSPLARGLLLAQALAHDGWGIIPARAGFTETSRIEVAWTYGSSPLARGLPFPAAPAKPAERIIPARAGFTSRGQADRDRGRDHPRSRGVYTWDEYEDWDTYGSSPLARGLRPLLNHVPVVAGIIPARAGFTTDRPDPFPPASDHPRSRGVYHTDGVPGRAGAGSSPLARGLR